MSSSQNNLAARSQILATDISRAALGKARAAAYGSWSLRGDDAELARGYLTRVGDRWVLDDRIRRLVSFEYLNLALDVYPSLASGVCGMDLILCRNVLIYFDAETIRQVARRLFASLSVGGCLLCGPSDPILAEWAPFQVMATPSGLIYRRVGATDHNAPQRPTVARDFDASVAAEPRRAAAKGDRAAAAARLSKGSARRPPRKIPSGKPAARQFTAEEPTGPLPLDGTRTEARVPSESLTEARQALAQADYRRVIALTRLTPENAEASRLHVRALANLDLEVAQRACQGALKRHPLAVELHHLHAVLLLQLGRDAAAGRAARHVIYVDRSLAVAHFTLGAVLRRTGDLAGARRAYRNARNLAAMRPADEIVPLSEGEQASRLVEAAEAQLALLASDSRSFNQAHEVG